MKKRIFFLTLFFSLLCFIGVQEIFAKGINKNQDDFFSFSNGKSGLILYLDADLTEEDKNEFSTSPKRQVSSIISFSSPFSLKLLSISSGLPLRIWSEVYLFFPHPPTFIFLKVFRL